ncbi:MAG TPA: hypothetical protein VFE14_15305, partial [Micromonosporaceae bacterium]|nr:hypothetical protein [Micromonosporaceae bacterium]
MQLQLGLLVLIAGSAWKVPSGPVGAGSLDRHAELLRRILSNPRGRAWIREHLPSGDTEWTLRYAPAARAAEFVASLSSRITARCLDGRRRLDRGETLVVIRGYGVMLDRERFLALTGTPADGLDPEPGFHVGLDFRFYLVTGEGPGELRCNVSVTVWSSVPASDVHPAADVAGRRITLPPDTYRRVFSEVAARMEPVLETSFERADPRVFGREHVPVFWVVAPADRATDPASYLGDRITMTARLAEAFLDASDVRDSAMASSVLDGEFLVLRRLRRMPRQRDVAHYLIMLGGVRRGVTVTVAQQVWDAARLVAVLTDVEVRGGAVLDGVVSDLGIWQNHLKLYDMVATRGYRLWDALSTHLAMRKWLKLSRAHHAVELMHQILLQGIADIAHLAAVTQDCVARVNQTANDLRALFDDYAITERHIPGVTHGLRAALAETGLMDRVRQHADGILQEANRVKTSYDDLLRAIAYAFDERRVREADALQKASALLGISIALVGAVTVLDATVNMKPESGSPQPTIFRFPLLDHVVPRIAASTSIALGVVLMASAVAAVVWLMRLGTLGSSRFRNLYDGYTFNRYGVWHLLKDTSTETLEAFRRTRPTDDEWRARDARLAEQFAKMWDETTAMRNLDRNDRMGRDITGLSHQIEQWGLQSLLVTERALRMHHYRLPRLTCLYRCVIWPDRSPATRTDPANSRVAMVSDNELARSLRTAGLSQNDLQR